MHLILLQDPTWRKYKTNTEAEMWDGRRNGVNQWEQGTKRHPSSAWSQLKEKPNLTSGLFSYQSHQIPPYPFLWFVVVFFCFCFFFLSFGFYLCSSSLNQISLICIQKIPDSMHIPAGTTFHPFAPRLCTLTLLGFGRVQKRVWLTLLR